MARKVSRIKLNGRAVDAEVIYPRLVAIEARKPDGQLYRHDFKPGTTVLGLPDGSILCRGRRRLWKVFTDGR